MSTRPQELNKIIADLRQIIVGKVAMPTDQIEQITLFLFLKQLSKKHDELVRIGSKELIFTGACTYRMNRIAAAWKLYNSGIFVEVEIPLVVGRVDLPALNIMDLNPP